MTLLKDSDCRVINKPFCKSILFDPRCPRTGKTILEPFLLMSHWIKPFLGSVF